MLDPQSFITHNIIILVWPSIHFCCTAVTQIGYQWACTAPDHEAGRKYIPSLLDRHMQIFSTSNPDEININTVRNLSESCSGEVTAIEYCYQYDIHDEEEVVFSWMVMMLEDTPRATNFTITASYTI